MRLRVKLIKTAKSYTIHPDSGLIFVGYKIELLEEVLKCAKRCAVALAHGEHYKCKKQNNHKRKREIFNETNQRKFTK